MSWIGARVVARGVDGDGLVWRADWRRAIDLDTEPFPLSAVCGLMASGDARPRSAGFGLAGWQRFSEASLLPGAEEGP